MCNTVLCTTYVRVLPPRGVDLCLARASSVPADGLLLLETLSNQS